MGTDERAFYVRQGKTLLAARKHNAPLLGAAGSEELQRNLMALGVDVAPHRLSQGDLAKLVGCSRRVVGAIEAGRGYKNHYLYACMLRYLLPETQPKGRR